MRIKEGGFRRGKHIAVCSCNHKHVEGGGGKGGGAFGHTTLQVTYELKVMRSYDCGLVCVSVYLCVHACV